VVWGGPRGMFAPGDPQTRPGLPPAGPSSQARARPLPSYVRGATRPGLPPAGPSSQVPPAAFFVYGVDILALGHPQVELPVVARF